MRNSYESGMFNQSNDKFPNPANYENLIPVPESESSRMDNAKGLARVILSVEGQGK